MKKIFKGKAIYNPAGKAGEYSYWACNFYVGCSNGCSYCYCKQGILKGTMGMDKPSLKSCFKNEDHAFDVFKKEVLNNLDNLQKHGLFFSFTTDPMLPETKDLTIKAAEYCFSLSIPVKILTKCVDWFWDIAAKWVDFRHLVAIGITITGMDELESNAVSSEKRIWALTRISDYGFFGYKTFLSIEPVIDLEKALNVIRNTLGYVDLYKIGLLSSSNIIDISDFYNKANFLIALVDSKVYWKESIAKLISVDHTEPQIVNRDYNMFNYNLS